MKNKSQDELRQRYCRNCGLRIENNDNKYCTNCGTEIINKRVLSDNKYIYYLIANIVSIVLIFITNTLGLFGLIPLAIIIIAREKYRGVFIVEFLFWIEFLLAFFYLILIVIVFFSCFSFLGSI